MADPNNSLMTIYTQNGLRQFDFEAGTQKPSGQAGESAATVGLGFGINERWFSEIYLSAARSQGESSKFDSAALVNTIALTDQQSPFDLGLYTEIEYEQDRSAGYKATFGPLLQSSFGLTTANLNLLLHRNYLADDSNRMHLDYQWQLKRRWDARFEYGIQGFGELGEWDHWAPQDQQAHRVGPVILGKAVLGEAQVIHYNAAMLFDILDRQHSTTIRFQATYGF